MTAKELMDVLKKAGDNAEVFINDLDGHGMVRVGDAKVYIDLADQKRKIVTIEVTL